MMLGVESHETIGALIENRDAENAVSIEDKGFASLASSMHK